MRAGVLAAALLLPAVAAAQDCSPVLPGGTQLESARYSLGYRAVPGKPAVGKHFSLEIAVCPKPGTAAPESVRVDAHMPEHRHGMNYRTRVTQDGPGRFHVSGLLFHMPGRWEVLFGFSSPAGTTDRATATIELE